MPRTRSQSAAARDQRRLDDLGESGRELGGRQGLEEAGIDEDRPGHLVGADVVLGLGQIDPGLAAVSAVDLGDERRRDLDQLDPALECRRAEAGEIAGNAAAEGDDAVVAPRAGVGQRPQHPLGLGQRLRGFARRHRYRSRRPR